MRCILEFEIIFYDQIQHQAFQMSCIDQVINEISGASKHRLKMSNSINKLETKLYLKL